MLRFLCSASSPHHGFAVCSGSRSSSSRRQVSLWNNLQQNMSTSSSGRRQPAQMRPSIMAVATIAAKSGIIASNLHLTSAAAIAPVQRYQQEWKRHISNVLGGKFLRMLDLGGAPSASNSDASTKALNLNKNCHLQAVIFDFGLLTQSVTMEESQAKQQSQATTKSVMQSNETMKAAAPDASRIQEVAKLLNVDMSGSSSKRRSNRNEPWEDDLSLILREATVETPVVAAGSAPAATTIATPQPTRAQQRTTIGATDIRSKYADKLRQVTGGEGTTSTDSSNSDSSRPKGGDAEHLLAARAHVAGGSSGGGSSSSQWMAGTGTGRLLNYLHMRSMKLALAATPIAVANTTNGTSEEARQMQDFAKQLKDKVSFDVLVAESHAAPQLIAATLAQLQSKSNSTSASGTSAIPVTLSPHRCLWVSHRDDCLRAAKDAGLLTARILLRPNAPRGNVSAHYTVTDIDDVQGIVNEINGISFNAVLHGT